MIERQLVDPLDERKAFVETQLNRHKDPLGDAFDIYVNCVQEYILMLEQPLKFPHFVLREERFRLQDTLKKAQVPPGLIFRMRGTANTLYRKLLVPPSVTNYNS